MNAKLTPLMRQYWDVKGAHGDKILFFRMGDFFEIFHDDALKAAPILGIALTKRNQKAADETPMCGVPHHSVGTYINKLLQAGHKVALCDQIEDPKFAKGIVKRAVTRILSPGMVYDADTLDQLQPNYVAAFDTESVAFVDVSTGESFYFLAATEFERKRVLEVLRPAELIISSRQAGLGPGNPAAGLVTVFDETSKTNELESCARLRSYIAAMDVSAQTARAQLNFEKRELTNRLELTQNSIRHLEIFENNRGQTNGSLFHVINKTRTPGGGRRLRTWLAFPLARLEEIQFRQEQIQFWFDRSDELRQVREKLGAIGDLERRAMKLANSNCTARDFRSFLVSLNAALELPLTNTHQDLRELRNIIDRALVEEPPASTKDGNFIRKGVSERLDELIELSEESQTLLARMEQEEKSRTGINSLKIKYNNVFGYSIEITNANREKVPESYRRRQTLASAERYVTDELEGLEQKILSARTQRVELEQQIFEDLRRKTLKLLPSILALAGDSAHLDVITALAWVAIESNFVRPRLFESGPIKLEGLRHPVVERLVQQPFVANDIQMSGGDCMILTGPNMAGKSTLMRQVALCALLGQVGAFVPARSADLPIFSKILTRIGSNDSLSEGLSTFMVEMKETAELLQEADSRSLVILDEVGRGTSTYDGMSLAQAILEHLLSHNKATVFFATHYHELTQLEGMYPHAQNFHMAIRDRAGELSFLYTLTRGPANKSYGIHVAKLAGLPKDVVSRAEKILGAIESNQRGQMSLFDTPAQEPFVEVRGPSELEKVAEELKSLSVDSTTPLDALKYLSKWQQYLS